jgi:carbonic anhydrase
MRTKLVTVALAVAAVSAAAVARIDAEGRDGAGSLARLKAGNARFVSNPEDTAWLQVDTRTALAKGQSPFATILSCADSRVPPEIVFRATLGELFVVRAAGNVTDRTILASVEYAVEHLHTPLVVVMGHESCGAVKAAAETPASKSLGPNLDYLLKAIRPSVAATNDRPEGERLRAAILENVEETLNDMIQESAILKDAARAGHVTFVGAYYELTTGRVHFSEPVHMPLTESAKRGARPTADHHVKGGGH